MTNIGQRIRMNRVRLGLSQQELAASLSVSQSAVGQWERGRSFPRGRYMNALSALFGIGVSELFHPDEIEALELARMTQLHEYNQMRTADPLPGTPSVLSMESAQNQVKEDKELDSFEETLFELLGKLLGPAKRYAQIKAPNGRTWIVDYLSETLLLEVRHPKSFYSPFSAVPLALWEMVVQKNFLGPGRKYVVIFRNPFPGNEISVRDQHAIDLAMKDAEIVGIKIIVADTPEQAAKHTIDYTNEIEGE